MALGQIRTLFYLFTTFPPEVSGSALYNWERVKWFAEQGKYRIVVLAPDWQNTTEMPLVPAHLKENLIIEPYPSKPWLAYKLLQVPTFSAANLIRDRIAYYQPDLITVVDVERLFWFGTWHLPGIQYAKKHGIPYITEYHTDYYNHVSTYPGGTLLRNFILKPLTNYLYHQFDSVIAISNASSKGLEQIGIKNFQTIPLYSINTSNYSPTRRNSHCLQPWLSPKEQENKVLFFLGRLAPEKRLDVLIKAFVKLQQKQLPCSLVIAGDGPAEVVNSLKNLADPFPNIHFTGFIHGEMKADLLASCDVYCSPSPYETFGVSVVEAMASGIPVVTVNSGGVSDYLLDEVNGYLVAPDNIEQFAEAIEKALLNDNQAIVQAALKTAEGFSIDYRCQKLNHYYEQVLK